jgi:hypothetical protein
MKMKSQDIVVLMGLVLPERRRLTYAGLGETLAISASEVHAAMRRNVAAGLLESEGRRPLPVPLMEFLVHGLRYVFPAVQGAPTRGLPTCHAAPVLAASFPGDGAMPPVWPYAGPGAVRGMEFVPLHPNVPFAAVKDLFLYDLLALTDVLRGGRVRERDLAVAKLETIFQGNLQ